MSRIGRFLSRLLRALYNALSFAARAVLFAVHGILILGLLSAAIAAIVTLVNFQWHLARSVMIPEINLLYLASPATTLSFVSANEGIPPAVWTAATLVLLVASLYAFILEQLRRVRSTPAPLYLGVLAVLMLQLALLYSAESFYDFLWKTFK